MNTRITNNNTTRNNLKSIKILSSPNLNDTTPQSRSQYVELSPTNKSSIQEESVKNSPINKQSIQYEADDITYKNYFSTFLENNINESSTEYEKELLKNLCDSFKPLEYTIKNNLPTSEQLIKMNEYDKLEHQLYKMKIDKEKNKSKEFIKNLLDKRFRKNSSKNNISETDFFED